MENLFGDKTLIAGSHKSNPCVVIYGKGPADSKCKNCIHLKKKTYTRSVYKCALRVATNSSASDHKPTWPTCGKFEHCGNDGGLVVAAAHLTQIKQLLLDGKRLSVQSVLQMVGTQELRTYIPILRREHDMNIRGEWKQNNGKRFKEYFLMQ